MKDFNCILIQNAGLLHIRAPHIKVGRNTVGMNC